MTVITKCDGGRCSVYSLAFLLHCVGGCNCAAPRSGKGSEARSAVDVLATVILQCEDIIVGTTELADLVSFAMCSWRLQVRV